MSAPKTGKRRRNDVDSDSDSELNDSHQLDQLLKMLTERKKREGRKADKIRKVAVDSLERDLSRREMNEVKCSQVITQCLTETRNFITQAKEIVQDISKKHAERENILRRSRQEVKKFVERNGQLIAAAKKNDKSYNDDKNKVEKQIKKLDQRSKQTNECMLESLAKSEKERLSKLVCTCLTNAFPCI